MVGDGAPLCELEKSIAAGQLFSLGRTINETEASAAAVVAVVRRPHGQQWRPTSNKQTQTDPVVAAA